MLHAPPLPGSPQFAGNWQGVIGTVLADARMLVEGGVHALLLENYGDVPFFPGRVPCETVAHITYLAAEVRRRFDVPLGINVLRNDGQSALAVAAAVGGAFIRVNVLCGARVADQGILAGIAHDLLRARRNLQASQIDILADIDVKHSAPLALRDIEDEATETFHRGAADGLIVTGSATGSAADRGDLHRVRAAVGERPVLLGSGATAEALRDVLPHVDGLIVGTSLKRDEKPTSPIDADRVRRFMQAYHLAISPT